MNNDRKWELHDAMEDMTTTQRHEYIESLSADEQADWICGGPPKTHAEMRAEAADHVIHALLTIVVIVAIVVAIITA